MGKRNKREKAEWLNNKVKWSLPIWAFNLLYKKQKGEYLSKRESRRLKKIKAW